MSIKVNVKTPSGDKFSIDINAGASVLEFKKKIQETKGFAPSDQKVIFKGRVLKDDKDISSYGMKNEDSCVLMVKKSAQSSASQAAPAPAPAPESASSDSGPAPPPQSETSSAPVEDLGSGFKVNVKTTTNQKFFVDIGENCNVGQLKKAIFVKEKIPTELQRLIYKGKVLADKDTLKSYGMESEHTVILVKSKPKGNKPKPAQPAQPTTTQPQQPQQQRSGQQQAPPNLNALFGNLGGMMGQGGGGGMPNLAGLMGQGGGGMDPQMMMGLMQNPMIQNMMAQVEQNPELYASMMQNHPMIRGMAQQNPQLAQMLQNPQSLRAAIQMQRAMGNLMNAQRQFQQPQQLPQRQAQPSQSTQSSGSEGSSGTTGQQGSSSASSGSASQPSSSQNGSSSNSGTSNSTDSGSSSSGTGTSASTGSSSTGSSGSGSSNSQPQAQPQMPPFNFMNLLGGQMGGQMGGQGQGQNPWANLFGQMQAPQQQQQQNVQPEILYRDQLNQLNAMGFNDAQRNIQALIQTGGNVQAAVNRLLEG